MTIDESFKDFVLDQLNTLPNIRAKRMFGGYGLYSDEIFFVIIFDGVLYFKTNEKTKQSYIDAGSDCFKPNPRQTLKNYYEVPSDILDDPTKLTAWAEESIQIAN